MNNFDIRGIGQAEFAERLRDCADEHDKASEASDYSGQIRADALAMNLIRTHAVNLSEQERIYGMYDMNMKAD